jgi:hypothetical protein
MANTGVGATLVLSGASSFTGRWTSIGGFNQTVAALDDTALSATDYKEFVPDDLAEIDPITVELFANVGTAPPAVGLVPTVTITYPKQPGQTVAATLTGTAIITRFNQPELAVGQRLMSTLEIQFDGKTGPVFTPAT